MNGFTIIPILICIDRKVEEQNFAYTLIFWQINFSDWIYYFNFSAMIIKLYFYLISIVSVIGSVWKCPDVSMSYKVAKNLTSRMSFGHYQGSCLNSFSKDFLFVFCEEETFCGTNLIYDVSIDIDQIKGKEKRTILLSEVNISRLARKSWPVELLRR